MRRRDLFAGGAAVAAAAAVTAPATAEARSSAAVAVFNVRAHGAIGNGTADDTAAIRAAVDAALATATGGTVWFPAGTYRITDQIELNGAGLDVVGKALTLQGVGDATVLKVDNKLGWDDLPESNAGPARALFRAQGIERSGSRAALSAAAPAGARSVEVPAAVAGGGNYAPGAVLALEDPTQVAFGGQLAFELHTVVSRVGNRLQLDSPLIFPYTVGAGQGECYEVIPVRGLTLRDLSITAFGGPLDAGHRGVYSAFFRFAQDATIENVRVFQGPGGFQLVNTLDSHVTDCTVDGLPWYADGDYVAYGYGISLNGACKNIAVVGLVGRACRHLVTTLGDSRGGGLSYGVASSVEVVGGIGEGADTRSDGHSSYAIWDTHGQATDITFRRCVAYGSGTDTVQTSGKPGFQVRGRNVKLVDCVAKNNAGPGITVVQNEAENLVISGGEVAGNGGAGIAFNPPNLPSTASVTVEGVEIHHNAWVGVHWRGGTRVHVTNCYIHDNGQAGLLDQAAEGAKAAAVVICGNIIPGGSSVQANSLSGVGDGAVPAVFANNILRGHGAGSDGTTGSAVVSQNNLVDP